MGYDEGGQLTEAVRRKPYSVILLDEIEKAHPDVFNILLQVLDDGRLTDNKGRVANFKNTIIIMTSNIGANFIQDAFENTPDIYEATEKAKKQVFDTLRKTVRPEFLNRIDETIMFTPLSKKEIRQIVEMQFNEIKYRLEEANIKLEIDDKVLDYLGELGFDPQFGARPLKRVLQRNVLNELSKEILAGNIARDSIIAMTMTDHDKIQFLNLDKLQF